MPAMTSELAVGLQGEQSYRVTEEMGPVHLPMPVLSTPHMIGLIEQTCLASVAPHLPEGSTTVGTHVCVSHKAAASAGEEVTVHCRLTEIVKRRLRFEVSVTGPAGTLCEGTHERAMVDLARLTG
jgi:predicted thioesterase